MLHRIFRRRKIGSQVAASLLANVICIDLGAQHINVIENVAEETVIAQKLAELLAQHQVSSIAVADVNRNVIDVVGMPDFPNYAGICFGIPDPAIHEWDAFRIAVV